MEDGYWLFILAAAVLAAALFLIWRYRKTSAENVTEEDIKTMVNEGHEQGLLQSSEAKMISNIFEFDDKEAGDIMTHRKNIVALDGSLTLGEAADFVIKEGKHSRFPVYGADMDDIIGTVHIRDILVHAQDSRKSQLPVSGAAGVVRRAHFIPETRNINSLFKEMQSRKVHMAIVIDEYGQTAGLVTMEDILEEIVGNILDEYDVDETFIARTEDGTLVMRGMTPLEDAQEALGVLFDEEDRENYDTLNGLLISRLDRIPEEGEKTQIEYGGFIFSIVKVENKMIHTVRVTRAVPRTLEADEEK